MRNIQFNHILMLEYYSLENDPDLKWLFELPIIRSDSKIKQINLKRQIAKAKRINRNRSIRRNRK